MTQSSTTVSAPGKLMLFGEHAVLHGEPCIVTAVNQYMTAEASLIDEPVLKLYAPEVDIANYTKPLNQLGTGDIPRGARFVERVLKNMQALRDGLPCHPEEHRSETEVRLEGSGRPPQSDTFNKGIHLSVSSDFNSLFGFGSSSAATVCTTKAVNELWNLQLNPKELFDICYQTVLHVQGKGSGFDIAAALYGGTIYFQNKGEIIDPLELPSPVILSVDEGGGGAEGGGIVVGYSGEKADTVTIINQVNEHAQKNPSLANVYSDMGEISREAKPLLLQQDWKQLGELMNRNQELLEQLGVSTSKLNAMITAACSAGAYGAKLSGAGGGDCMIALASPENEDVIKNAITDVGGIVLNVECNAILNT